MSPFHSPHITLAFIYGGFPMNKKVLTALAVCGIAAVSFAEGGAGFDGASLIGDANSAVNGIVTAIAALLGSAVALYVGFVGYRKLREGLNKC